jgi:hypothetical protein
MRAAISLAGIGELTDVHRFWYRIYVEGMSRHLGDPLTDHQAEALTDPLVNAGNLFVARDHNGDIVATLMTTLAGDHDLGKYEGLYGIDQLSPTARARSSITTKLMVAEPWRCTRLPMLMARATYEHALSQGIERDYIDCNDHLVSFFKRLGYRPHLGRIVHRDYGAVNSMVLQLTDEAHLRKLRSPFLKSLQQHGTPYPDAAIDNLCERPAVNTQTNNEEQSHVAA